MIRHHRSALSTLGIAAVALHTALAHAEPSATERATAEALFQQAAALMNEQQFEKACQKFEASQQLDPALGTMLRLADCYDRAGKTASAWAMFQDVRSLAERRSETERQQIAIERIADLEKRLSKLALDIDPKNAGLELTVRLNGAQIPKASWDTPLPVDPGKQPIEVSAPGYAPFSSSVEVQRGPSSQKFNVPALAPLPTASEKLEHEPQPRPAEPSRSGTTQRTLAYVAGGVGLLGLGAGTYFGLHARSLNESSLDHCRPTDATACTSEGDSERYRARSAASISTVTFIAGGALLTTGLVLLLTAPHAESSASRPTLRLSAAAAPQAGRVALEGTW